MSAIYGAIVIVPIYGQFGEHQKPDFGCMIHSYYFYIINNLSAN